MLYHPSRVRVMVWGLRVRRNEDGLKLKKEKKKRKEIFFLRFGDLGFVNFQLKIISLISF